MNSRIRPILVIFGMAVLLGCALAQFSAQAQDKAPARGKWEYKIVRIAVRWPDPNAKDKAPAVVPANLPPAGFIFVGSPPTMREKDLTELGEQGWELVGITGGQLVVSSAQPVAGGKTNNTVQYGDTVYHFKRPK